MYLDVDKNTKTKTTANKLKYTLKLWQIRVSTMITRNLFGLERNDIVKRKEMI